MQGSSSTSPGAFASRRAPFSCECCFGAGAATLAPGHLPPDAAGFRRLQVGAVKVYPLQDAVGSMSLESVFVGADPTELAGYLNVDGNLEMSFGCVLLQSARLNILCDTSCGDVVSVSPQPPSRLLPELLLSSAGLTPADIDIVTYSHAHGDHVAGGIVRDDSGELVPTFPHARYLIRDAELEHARGSDTFATFFEPLEASGLLEAVPSEGDYVLTDEITLQVCLLSSRLHSILLNNGFRAAAPFWSGHLGSHPF